jgi:hypothetical protein
MKKIMIVLAVLIVLFAGAYYYFNRAAKCFASSGAVELPRISEIEKGQPIALRFKMLRIAAPGCFTGHSSESYKDVSCGYRIGDSGKWETGSLAVIADSEIEFVVECLIPPVPIDTTSGAKLEYYFQYSPWGRPPEKKSASLSIK